jgi:hypothetical protein
MVLGPFAETKGPRLQGRNPASNKWNCRKVLGVMGEEEPADCSFHYASRMTHHEFLHV